MNKRYDQTDEERDQSRKLEREEVQRQKSRQQRSQDAPHRQQGGWGTEEDRDRRPISIARLSRPEAPARAGPWTSRDVAVGSRRSAVRLEPQLGRQPSRDRETVRQQSR